MGKHAQFTAVVKKMATDDKKIVVNLEMVGKLDTYAIAAIVDMVGDKVVVNLGNPQMTIDFEGGETHKGLSVTADSSGVVLGVSSDEDSEDEFDDYQDDDHMDIFDESDEDSNEVGDESKEVEEAVTSEQRHHHEERQDNDSSECSERDSTEEAPVISSDKVDLETFILSGQAPIFDEIEYDFPALLNRKRNGETWISIASSIGTSSTKLQAAWAKYKKLVSEHMKQQNDKESGAA